MRKTYALIFLLVFISTTGFVSASDERDVFIIDKDGNTKYQYQTLFASDYGYYIEAQSVELGVPENVTNLKFFDSYDELIPTKITSEREFNTYTLNIKEVEYGNPYVVGFSYDLPKYTTVRYKENYFFEYPIYLEQDSQKEVHICIPSSATAGATPYDSTPIEESTTPDIHDFKYYPMKKFPLIDPLPSYAANEYHKTKEAQFQEIDVCPNGYNDNLISDVNRGDITRLKFDFHSYDSQVDNYDSTSGKLSITAPVVYKQTIDHNAQLIEKTLHSIDAILNLNSPLSYHLTFVGDNDRVLESNSIISLDDGTVFIAISVLNGDSDQLLQINVLRGLINSAMLNTYGQETDTFWWITGALTNLALIVMKENGLPTNDVQLILNDVKDTFKELTTNQIIEFLKSVATDPQSKVLIDSGIVDEIDTYCPNHAIKLNKITKDANLNFLNDKEFNNYMLYNLRGECSKDISEIFDKYRLEHDNVRIAVDKLQNMQEKFSRINIKRKDIPEINTINTNLNAAQEDLKRGKVEEALRLLESSENLYDTKLQRLLGILEEYTNAENKAEAIPFIFSIPSKFISSSKLDDAIEFIKTDEFDSARNEINKSLFWSNNAIILSLILYVVIVGLIFWVFRTRLKNKSKHRLN
jgi:hypothetical protein